MKVIATDIDGLKIIEPDIHRDERGHFAETYNSARYRAAGVDCVFVQDNESLSQKGVLRGLHWQAGEWAQAKLVRVARGAVWDVAVDIRRGSPTFGRHAAVTLSAANARQFFIPRGFAHGFLVLEDDTLFTYKCDRLYHPEAERGLKFDAPELGIAWPELDAPRLLSPKDRLFGGLDAVEPWSADDLTNATKEPTK